MLVLAQRSKKYETNVKKQTSVSAAENGKYEQYEGTLAGTQPGWKSSVILTKHFCH